MQTEHSSGHSQIPDNAAHQTSSIGEHQVDVEAFHCPSCAYANPTTASTSDDWQLGGIT
jgi:hypothetical protein